MNSIANITGLILAGGAGRRVGRRDKGLIEWRGQALVAHVAQRLQPQVGRLLISCNRNFDQYQQFAETTVADSRRDFQGPLAGLEAVTPLLDTRLLVVVACDTPLLPADLVKRLVAALADGGNNGADVSYAYDGIQNQYLCAAMRRQCLSSLPAFLDEGHRAVRHWYQRQRGVAVDFSNEPERFNNYNHLD